MGYPMNEKNKFGLGQIVITVGAQEAVEQSSQNPIEFLKRHVSGDWGDICEEDKKLNDEAISHEETADTDEDLRGRVLSEYKTKQGERIWVITEYTREVTTILLPEEY